MRRDRARGVAVPEWRGDTPEGSLESATAYALFLLDDDRKATGLKSLQGRIWQEGFAAGSLRGQVYPDVPAAFERWRRQGRQVAIFSSGSVLAQRLLFATTPAGDLTPYIGAHFDTTTGSTAWYLFANPSSGRPALEIGRLIGHESPELFQKSPNATRVGGGTVDPTDGDFDTDSVEWKVRHVMGGTLMDPKSALASTGTGS